MTSLAAFALHSADYTPERSLAACIDAIMNAPLPGGLAREIVFVTMVPRTRPWAIAQKLAGKIPRAAAVSPAKQQGKGAALRRAVAENDGRHRHLSGCRSWNMTPRTTPVCSSPLSNRKPHVVFGSRFTGEERKILYFCTRSQIGS